MRRVFLLFGCMSLCVNAIFAVAGPPLTGVARVTLLSEPGRAAAAPVHVEAIVNDHQVVRGKPFVIRIQVTIDKGFHINSDHPKDKFLIPTQVIFKSLPGIVFKSAKFPPAEDEQFEFSSERLSVFQGEIEVEVPAVCSKEAGTGQKVIAGSLKYQACDKSTCYPPRIIPFSVTVEVVQ